MSAGHYASLCEAEHFYVAESTIPGAGLGLFAKHDIPMQAHPVLEYSGSRLRVYLNSHRPRRQRAPLSLEYLMEVPPTARVWGPAWWTPRIRTGRVWRGTSTARGAHSRKGEPSAGPTRSSAGPRGRCSCSCSGTCRRGRRSWPTTRRRGRGVGCCVRGCRRGFSRGGREGWRQTLSTRINEFTAWTLLCLAGVRWVRRQELLGSWRLARGCSPQAKREAQLSQRARTGGAAPLIPRRGSRRQRLLSGGRLLPTLTLTIPHPTRPCPRPSLTSSPRPNPPRAAGAPPCTPARTPDPAPASPP